MSSRSLDLVAFLQETTERTVKVLLKHGSRHNWHTTLVAMSIQGVIRQTLRFHVLSVRNSWEGDHSSKCRLQLDRLPAETLERILHYLPLRYRITLSQTCHMLRSYLLTAAHLWTKVNTGPTAHVLYEPGELGPARAQRELLRTQQVVERSNGLPTQVRASFNPLCLQDPSMLVCWQSILLGATTLRLQPYTEQSLEWPGPRDPSCTIDHGLGPVSPRAWALFAESLCKPAPSLRSLEIVIPTSMRFWETRQTHITPVLWDDLLGGVPAVLRSCHLRGMTLRSVAAPLTTLTSFDYQPNPNVVSAEFMLSILHEMPCLETLGISLRLQDPEAIAPLITGQPRAWHQCLNRVALGTPVNSWVDHEPEDFVQLVALFTHVCAKPDVTIVVDLRESGPHFLAGRLPFPTGLVDCPQEIVATYQLTAFRDDRLAVLGCHRTFAKDWVTSGTASYTALTHLIIGEFRWPEIAALSGNIPRLISLSIILRRSQGHPMALYESHEEPNLFTSAALQPALECPSLEDVELAVEPDSYFRLSWVLSLTDVCHFIQTGLRFTSPRLRTLVLSGVRATTDPDPVAAFIAFQQLADDVSVRAEASHEIRRMSVLGQDRHLARVWAPSHVFATGEVANSRASDQFYRLGAP